MESLDETPAKLSIPEWSKADRPRERMLANGPKAMSEAELEAAWFADAQNVGVTAGTSTGDETVEPVIERLKTF